MAKRLVLLILALATVWATRSCWGRSDVDESSADVPELGSLGELFSEPPGERQPLSMRPDAGGSGGRELTHEELPSAWVRLRDGGSGAEELADQIERLDRSLIDLAKRIEALGESGAILSTPAGLRFVNRTVEAIEAGAAADVDRRRGLDQVWAVLELGVGGFAGARTELRSLVARLRGLGRVELAAEPRVHRHRVAQGETLGGIVGRLRIAFDRPWTVAEIARWNGVENVDRVRPGRVLEFPLETPRVSLHVEQGLCVVGEDGGPRTGCVIELPEGFQELGIRRGTRVRIAGWAGPDLVRIEVAGESHGCRVSASEQAAARLLLVPGVSLSANR